MQPGVTNFSYTGIQPQIALINSLQSDWSRKGQVLHQLYYVAHAFDKLAT